MRIVSTAAACLLVCYSVPAACAPAVAREVTTVVVCPLPPEMCTHALQTALNTSDFILLGMQSSGGGGGSGLMRTGPLFATRSNQQVALEAGVVLEAVPELFPLGGVSSLLTVQDVDGFSIQVRASNSSNSTNPPTPVLSMGA